MREDQPRNAESTNAESMSNSEKMKSPEKRSNPNPESMNLDRESMNLDPKSEKLNSQSTNSNRGSTNSNREMANSNTESMNPNPKSTNSNREMTNWNTESMNLDHSEISDVTNSDSGSSGIVKSETLPIPTVDVFGIPVSQMNMRETVEFLSDAIHKRKSLQVITANPIMFMEALQNPDYYAVMKQADLNVPDGTGLVWAAQYLAEGVKERVAGFDLMHELLKTGENYGWGVYLLGASADVIDVTAKRLQEMYPGVRIVGWRNGFFGADEDEAVVEAIRKASPDLLFVARSVYTQEPWIAQHRDKLKVPVMMGVGGSFDVIAGKTKRAPLIMQKMHLEWFYRLVQEPSRFPRMLALPRFVIRVLNEKRRLNKI